MSATPAVHGSLGRTPLRVGVSARHVHLCRDHVDALFGSGYSLHPKGELSQPGQYAAQECVVVAGPGGAFERVRVLGPVRSATQVEVSASDCRALGVPAVVRDSGDLAGTPGCVLIGPAGSVRLEQGLIVAARHIHMAPIDARLQGLVDRDLVAVMAGEGPRATLFANVLVRVSSDYRLELHLDVDEANAAAVSNGDTVWIVGGALSMPQERVGQVGSAGQEEPALRGQSPSVRRVLDLTSVPLVTEEHVIEAARQGLSVRVRAGALVTPLARDAARERRVELIPE
jgi:putative phosphotransacetylase